MWRFLGFSNEFTIFYVLDDEDIFSRTFDMDGSSKVWSTRPRLAPIREKNKKKQRPLGDISCVQPGSVIFSLRAYLALRSFLEPFGQFLEVECLNEGELLGDNSIRSQIWYLYNVTNIIACIDYEKSEKIGSGVSKPAFFSDAVPKDVQVFKDPLRVRTEIYLSGPAKAKLEELIVEADLTGAVFEQVA